MGIYQALYGVGMFIGPVLGGFIIEKFGGEGSSLVPVQGYVANFYAAMIIALIGAVFAFILSRKRA